MVSSLLEPELRIFFSVDLIGSTSYKQREAASNTKEIEVQSWLRVFSDFYKEFLICFITQLDQHKSHFGLTTYEKPCIWKKLGDELLFSAKLADKADALFFLESFRLAMVEYESNFRSSGTALGLKGTVWVAGFPVRNVKIPSDQDPQRVDDYIGPCIDIGFRLGKFSSARKLVLSVELVWLIAHFLPQEHDLPIYYDGKVMLKGFRGGEYPIFWVSKFGKPENDIEIILLNISPCNQLYVVKYCEAFIGCMSNDLQSPFIFDNPDFQRYVPPDYSQKLKMASVVQGEIEYVNNDTQGAVEQVNPNVTGNIAEELLNNVPQITESDLFDV